MVGTISHALGTLRRFWRDQAGNTLAIVAAALVPLAGMIGSGVDMSRAYMAKTRLQSACDAAALAGRRVMSNDTIDTTVTTEATRFFNFNFRQGLYQTAAFTPTITRPSAGTVRVTASTTIPTSIMRLFGFTSLPLNVTCDASLNLVNTDIMLVLDTTGSMNCLPPEPWNTQCPTEKSGSKVQALRQAVLALYDELAPVQTQLEQGGYRLRYGVVPYSSGLNIGRILANLNTDYIVDDWHYQSRVANYSTPTYIGTAGAPEAPVEQIYGSSITQAQCDKYGLNESFSGFSPSATTGGGPAPAATWARSFSNNEAPGIDWGWPGAADNQSGGSDNKRSCRRRYVETDTTYETRYKFTNWVYTPENYDVSDFRSGNPVTIATNSGGSVAEAGNYDAREIVAIATNQGTGVTPLTITSATWGGCIEERDTVTNITDGYGYTIPSGAYDLDIDLAPNSDATRWRPYWPDMVYRPDNHARPQIACPTESRRLQAWTRNALQSYIGGLTATGGTYHDNGMIWGARLLSPNGIFAADNPDSFNNMPVSRHIIYFTDGQLDTGPTIYSTRGMERWDKRVTGSQGWTSEDDLNGRHQQRFRMLCNAAKGQNITIWVVTLATALTDDLRNCASSPSHASETADQAQLRQRFIEIGRNIGALRVTQ